MKRIVAKTGQYERDGEAKGRYTNIGVIMSNDNGEFVLLDPTVNLAGVLIQQRLLNPSKASDKVMCSIFGDQPKQAAPKPKPQSQSYDDFEDDIPF